MKYFHLVAALCLLLASQPVLSADESLDVLLNKTDYTVISPFCIKIANEQYKQNISMEHELIYNICMEEHGFEKKELIRLKPHYLKFMHKGGG